MNRKYNIQLNLSPYANVYEDGGGMVYNPNATGFVRGNFSTDWTPQGISPNDAVLSDYQQKMVNKADMKQAIAEKGEGFLNTMNSSGGGGWAAAIAPAATNAINAITNTEASTAERVATAMGIPALAKIWTADNTAGDANLKAMQSNIDTFAKQNLIQDASSTFGANNAVKLNNKFIAPVSMTGVKDLSWKDFRGNMFKKGAAATLQGAAAGSVGGPWGALGGAVTGLFGSLFGGIGARSRAKKAYAEYQNKMATLTSQANSMYKQALTNQTLSNMQALANGNMSQRISDMANIRAYGGNLFDGGGDLTDEQQMVLADIQADPRILFTPKYSQWRDYIRRTSPDYLDRLYTSLPYEQQKDIYQNDREAWGALSNNVKGNFGSSKVRNESNEISPYVAGGLAATLAAPAAIEALGAYALPYTYNGAVSGLNAASDYVMGTRFGQAVAPYVSNLLKPAADATFAFEGAKNFASSEGFNKTWNHFANGEIANGITSGLGDALDLLMVGQGKPLLDATKEAATAIKKGGKYIKKQMTASSRAEKLLDELNERMIHTDRQLSALNDDRLKADRLKYKAKQFFPSPSADIPIPSYVDYQDKFYNRIKNLLENNKIDEAETLLNNVNSPYKITRLPNGEYGLPLYSETPYSDGFLLGEKKMYNPLTGQYDSYYLDPSGLPSNIDYLTGAGKKSVKMDGRSIPEDYRNTISKNIDYITNELYPGTSPFGSSVLASEGNLYTNPHDFEVYMPESMLGKYKTNEWSQISPDTYTFTHPKVGDIDFNILRETPEGFATGQRSWQLASRQHPDWYKQYADKRFEDIAKGVNRNPIEQDPLPWTPQELLENANPNVNTMTDALFANKNAKHRNRRLYYLNNAKIDDLKASINEYGNYVMGGNYKPSDVPLSAFNDPSTNSKILEKMGINGIDKSVTNDPERMKTLFEYSILHKQIYGRGITESNVASRGWDAVGSWLPETTGGTVHGVGLNTVRGGNSGHGNVYSILQPKSIEGITDPFDAIKVLDESVGIKELSNSERQQIRDAINNLGIDIYLPKEFSLKDVLRGTSGKKGVKYQQLNKAIEKITNTSGITDESEYGTGIYTSLWDLPQSKSANIIFGDLDRPNNPELLNTRNNTNPLFGEFLDRRVKNKVEKAINDSKMNSGRIYDSQSTVDRMYDVTNERYNKIDSYRDLINDRRRNVATKLAKAQSNAETIKQVSLPVGIGGAVFGGIAALSNFQGRRHQIIEDAQKAGIDIRMKRGEETSDEYYDRLERELIQMGFYGQEALEEYNQYNNTGYAMGGNLYTDLSPNMINLWSNKQQINQQKAMNQQFSLGLGNTAFANQFAGGGQMTSADVPENMQYYANGGTHEENPYGGIQVGTDQQGTPNFAEEGEFRWNDFVFSDRINVDANLLSSFNLAPATKHQNKKAAKGKLSYADMAKKYAKRNKELENDPITKNSMEAFMQRLANAQEYQKKAEQLEAQKQNELQDYKTALNKQNNNPMYGTMKYNGMGNATTQQEVNSGVDAGMGNPMSNADLSNVNRSGNEMMAAYGGNLFARGGGNEFPDNVLSEAYKKYRESQYPTIKNNEVTLKANPQNFITWVNEPDIHPVDYDYFFNDDSPTKYVGLSPTGIQPYIHPAASPINTYQYTPYKSRIGSNLPVYAPYSTYTYEFNGEAFEPQYFRHSNRIEDNYDANVNNFRITPQLGDNTNWSNIAANTPFYQNEGWGIDMRPTYMKVKNPNYNAPAVSTYATRDKNGKIMYDPNGKPFMSYPRTYEGMKSSDYPDTKVIGKTVDNYGFYLPNALSESNVITPVTTPEVSGNLARLNGNNYIPIASNGISPIGVPQTDNTGTTNTQITGNVDISNKVIDKTTSNTNPDAAVPSDYSEPPLYSTAGKYAQFGKGIMPMVWDWANKTNVAYDPYQKDADRLEALANEGPALRTADTIGGYRAPNLMDVERLNNSARAEGLAQMQAILDAANGNRGYVGAHSAQNNYNTQKGVGDNYVKAQEVNNTERLQTDQFNHVINVANQNAINAMYQDNQRAEQTQHQAALSGIAQAAALRQRENLHADEVNTERMENRATNQAAAVDNALNYFTTQAMENQELNTRNNDPTNPYWVDKYGRTHYTGDSGLTQAIRDAFGNDEYGRNGTFTGDRLTEWNDLIKNKKYNAKYLKEHPELWQHLVTQQREANRIDAEKAKQARAEELEALRGTYQSNLARLNALRDSGAIISDPSYNLYTGWADEDYSGNQGLLRTRNQALDQYITQIGNNYDRYLYEKQLSQNQAKALGGYINAGQNNNNDYYSYTRI